MKILYIARGLGSEKNGASQVMKRNRDALREIVGSKNLIEYYLPRTNLKNVFISLVQFGSYGVTKAEERKVLAEVENCKPDYVFIESSSFGSLYKRLSAKSMKSICFAHNLDTALARQEISSRNPLISWPKYISTYFNEKRAAKYADCLICLNERDSLGFSEMFGRKADVILPITFPERTKDEIRPTDTSLTPYYLFVGSDFFPNVEGICWFITNVAPYVDVQFRIVGSCCQNEMVKALSCPPNVTLVGYADDIDEEYRNAVGVIAPIFKGSGMKTKTIEAMSYGKSIFGTDEAFAGIDCDYSQIGGRCNAADEYIESLNLQKIEYLNDYSFELFNSKYSDSSFIKILKKYLY